MLYRIIALISFIALSACGSSSDSSSPSVSSDISYTISVEVQGATSGVVLSDGYDRITVTEAGSVDFPHQYGAGDMYHVTIVETPDRIACEVTAPVGFIGSVYQDVSVTCLLGAPYFLSGEADGFVDPLEIEVNGEIFVINEPGEFHLPFEFYPEDEFSVEFVEPRDAATCQIKNGFGSFQMEDINSLDIRCNGSSISGRIYTEGLFTSDLDTNDIYSYYEYNNSFTEAQEVVGYNEVHGFVSDSPADVWDGRFVDEPDPVDLLKVQLQKGQVISLHPYTFNNGFVRSDADLALYDREKNLIGFSDELGELPERITVPEDGEYYIEIEAFSGASRYTLSMSSPTSEVLVYGRVEEIVPNEGIVQLNSQDRTMRTSAAPLNADLTHFDMKRSTLARFNAGSYESLKGLLPFHDMELASSNPKAFDVKNTLKRIKELSLRADVSKVEPNYLFKANTMPSDPMFGAQWHLNTIDLPSAWEISTGISPIEEVVVAVIDTGVWLNHEDLAGKFVAGYDFISDPVSARDGDGLDSDPDDPGDSSTPGGSSWHGTHVAGTIAANTDNGVGVSGISWGARIMPVRVLGGNGGTTYDVVQGFRYAAGLSNDSGTVPDVPADVINMSLGGYGASDEFQAAIHQAVANGIIVIAAAGNDNTSAPMYPASYEGVVSVSATGFDDAMAPYSNYGNRVDIAAPGGNTQQDLNLDQYIDGVLSTFVEDNYSPVSSYRFHQGTSMATPHVAGVAALMKAVYPSLDAEDFYSLLVNGDLSDDLGGDGWDPNYGHGRLNAYKALIAAERLSYGGVPPESPPQIVLSNTQLSLTSLYSEAFIDVLNVGGSTTLGSITSSVAWLQVSAIDIGNDGFGTYLVTLDSASLEPGSYRAVLQIADTAGGTKELTVFADIQAPLEEQVVSPIHVVLYDPIRQLTVDGVIAKEEGNGVFSYLFNGVAPGSYHLIAGSDVDFDGYICDWAETCGAYPLLSQPVLVSVEAQEQTNIEDLNFSLELLRELPLNPNRGLSTELLSAPSVERAAVH